MISELMLPHIDIARASRKDRVGSYWGNPNVKGGVDKNVGLREQEQIWHGFPDFSLEWTKDKLVWKINGITIRTTTQGVPQVPMYHQHQFLIVQGCKRIRFAGLVEVDWIRCYQPS